MPTTYPRTKAYPSGASDGQRLPAAKLNTIDTNAAHSADPQYTTVTATSTITAQGNLITASDLSVSGGATIGENITSTAGSITATAGSVTAGNNVTAANNVTATTGNV